MSGGAHEASGDQVASRRTESTTAPDAPPSAGASPVAEREPGAPARAQAFADVRSWLGRTRAVALVVGILVAALQLDRASTGLISPYDEGYHLSYIQYVAHGHVPRVGDPMNTWAREAFSCHLVFPFGDVTDVPCGDVDAPRWYPEGGSNTAAVWPPLYYVYAAAITRPLAALGLEALYAARIASALLWALGAAALVLVARRFGANLAAAASAGLVAGAMPAANTLGAFVTPHSAQLLLSVVIGGTVLELMRRREAIRRGDVVAGLAVPPLAVMIVPHALVGITMAYIGLAAHWAWRARRGVRVPRVAWLVLLAPLLALALHAGWDALVDARATAFSGDVDTSQAQDPADVRDESLVRPLLAEWWHFWPGGVSGDDVGYDTWEVFAAQAAVVLAAGAVGIALLSSNPSPLARALALGVVVGGPLTAWIAERTFPFDAPARYGASVIGLALLIVALTVARRPSRPLLVLSALFWAAASVASWP